MIPIDGRFASILIQFNFSNPNILPLWAGRLRKPENPGDAAARHERKTGSLVVESTPRVSLAELIDGLVDEPYALVDATHQQRIGGYNGKSRYDAISFVFTREQDASITVAFNDRWDFALEGLRKLCWHSMWKVCAYDNPHRVKGIEVPDQRMLSLNMAAREALVDMEGQPLTVWEKDDRGNKTRKIPVKPTSLLQIKDSMLQIVSLDANAAVA